MNGFSRSVQKNGCEIKSKNVSSPFRHVITCIFIENYDSRLSDNLGWCWLENNFLPSKAWL